MLNLYFAPRACSFVPHVALERIKAATGAGFEATLVKHHKGEQTTPEGLAMPPNGHFRFPPMSAPGAGLVLSL